MSVPAFSLTRQIDRSGKQVRFIEPVELLLNRFDADSDLVDHSALHHCLHAFDYFGPDAEV
jgi:hypothetical protein